LGLSGAYAGCPVERVEVVVRSSDSGARLLLLANGGIEDTDHFILRFNDLYVSGFKRLDYEIGTLELLVEGGMVIERITVYLGQVW